YTVPDTEERRTRRGFIGAGTLEEYSAGVVFRHEHTLSGPKADRLELLRHTKTHTGQLFMLYSDAEKRIDALLADAETAAAPVTEMRDEYGVMHRLWVIAEPQRLAAIQKAMADQKLVIADGHHRYETALNYRNERRGSGERSEAKKKFLAKLAKARAKRAIGVYPTPGGKKRAFYVLTLREGVNLAQLLPNVSPLQRELDVVLLHEGILEPALGITPQA